VIVTPGREIVSNLAGSDCSVLTGMVAGIEADMEADICITRYQYNLLYYNWTCLNEWEFRV